MLSPGVCGAAERYDPLLPRPMAVYRTTLRHGAAELEILYKVSGRGTALLADARSGERVRLVGPLGRSFPEPRPGERVLLVGGGTGIASLFDLAARAALHAQPLVLLGARSAAELMGRADFESLSIPLRVATEDGSDGARGLVTSLLEQALDEAPAALVYACGPTPMMRRAAEIAAARGRPCLVSLENPMACGFGVCLGCAAPRSGGGFALVCRDGPVFDACAVDWERLA
jgi:dihydroorotate dehydrogenase electron transfer subunit